MKKTILHISDLHLSVHDSIETWFDKDSIFIEKLTTSIKANITELSVPKIDFIVITGDIANKSLEEEYRRVIKELDNVISVLNLKYENILILPGNHDINWMQSEGAYLGYCSNELKCERKPEKFAFEFMEKYSHYQEFHNVLCPGIFFDGTKAILWSVPMDEMKLIFIGLNTNHHECFSEDYHYGYVQISKLKEEYVELQKKYQDYKVIVFSHHIIANTNSENKAIKNYSEVLEFLYNHCLISTFICGHQHVGGAVESIREDDAIKLCAFGVGSLAKFNTENRYNLLIFENNDEKITLLKREVGFISQHGSNKWIKIGDDNSHELYNMKVEQIPEKLESDSLPTIFEEEKSNSIDTAIIDSAIEPSYVFKKYSELFLQIIRANKFLKSGHFHWSKQSRTLGFIDTSLLFSNFEYLNIAKSALLALIQEKNIKPDLILGLGMEGNLLSGNLPIILNCKFSYYPYCSRKVDHTNKEIQVDFTNVKNLILLTDVTHKAVTINDLIKDEFDNLIHIENIYLISVFYISKNVPYADNMFNHFDERLKFYFVTDEIKIEECGCKVGKENCSIYKNKLDTVFEFY